MKGSIIMARHPNQKIPTYSIKRAIEMGTFERVEYLTEYKIPEYILKNYKYTKEVNRNEM